MTCAAIRSCLIQDIKYHVIMETSVRKLWEILESKYSAKSIESRLYLKRRLYRFQFKQETSINDHLNAYTKLLADFTNIKVIKEENKILILLSFLSNVEYYMFVLTFINRRSTFGYIEVTDFLVNYELRKNENESYNASSGEVLATRGRGPEHQENQSRFKSRD